MWNKCKAILITTKQNSGLLLGQKLVSYDISCTNPNNDKYSSKQHLYIISKDEIKLSDNNEGWFLRTHSTINNTDIIQNPIFTSKYKYRKIIATTNKDLVTKYDERFKDVTINNNSLNQSLPQISQSFIEQYITEYNKGNIISDVLVEYEEFKYYSGNTGLVVNNVLKINKDNTISIKTVKDSFSKDEVKNLLFKFTNDFDTSTCISITSEMQNKWISENL